MVIVVDIVGMGKVLVIAGVGMVWEIVVWGIVFCFAREIVVVVAIVVAVIICSSMI